MPINTLNLERLDVKTKAILEGLINENGEKVTIISTYKLSEVETGLIMAKLFNTSNQDLLVDNLVDKTILGGLVIKFGSYYLDYSLKGQLDQIALGM